MNCKIRQLQGLKVLVTGASGFIGPHLVRALCQSGAEVHALSRRKVEQNGACPRWWQVDLSDPHAANSTMHRIQPHVVFHLAGLAVGGRDAGLVLPTFHSNLETSVNILAAVNETSCKRMVLAGSLEEPETGDGLFVPSSPYAAAKWASSAYGRMFHALYKTPVVITRIFMTYGPGEPNEKKLIPYVINSLLQDQPPELSSGTRRVDWIFVEDVVQGLIQAALRPGIDGCTVDLGSGHLVTVREVVHRISKIINSEVHPRFGAAPDRPMEQVRVAHLEESIRLLGWCPGHSLDQGLQRTVKWHALQRRAP